MTQILSKSVIGVDLAPRGSGVCLLHPGWKIEDGLDSDYVSFDFTEFRLIGKLSSRERIQLGLNAAKILLQKMKEGEVDPCNVVIEDYAFSVRSDSVTKLAEIGGTVKSQVLLRHGDVPEVVSSSKARKFLTGGLRGKRKTDKNEGIKPLKPKEQIKVFLQNRGFIFPTLDVMDAFVVGYYWFCSKNSLKCGFKPADDCELVCSANSVRRQRKSD